MVCQQMCDCFNEPNLALRHGTTQDYEQNEVNELEHDVVFLSLSFCAVVCAMVCAARGLSCAALLVLACVCGLQQAARTQLNLFQLFHIEKDADSAREAIETHKAAVATALRECSELDKSTVDLKRQLQEATKETLVAERKLDKQKALLEEQVGLHAPLNFAALDGVGV